MLFGIAAVAAVAAADQTVTTEQTEAGLKLFDGRVRQILVKHCSECHGGKGEPEGEFDLTTREGLLKGGTIGVAVVPGSAKDSLLVWLIRHEDEPRMPEEGDKLNDADIAAITEWIDAGAPYSAPLPKESPKPKPPTGTRP